MRCFMRYNLVQFDEQNACLLNLNTLAAKKPVSIRSEKRTASTLIELKTRAMTLRRRLDGEDELFILRSRNDRINTKGVRFFVRGEFL